MRSYFCLIVAWIIRLREVLQQVIGDGDRAWVHPALPLSNSIYSTNKAIDSIYFQVNTYIHIYIYICRHNVKNVKCDLQTQWLLVSHFLINWSYPASPRVTVATTNNFTCLLFLQKKNRYWMPYLKKVIKD